MAKNDEFRFVDIPVAPGEWGDIPDRIGHHKKLVRDTEPKPHCPRCGSENVHVGVEDKKFRHCMTCDETVVSAEIRKMFGSC